MTTWHTEQHCVSVLWKREVVHLLRTAAIFNLRLHREKALQAISLFQTHHHWTQVSTAQSSQINKICPVWRKAANFSCSSAMRPDVSGRLWCHFLTPHTPHSHSWALSVLCLIGTISNPTFPGEYCSTRTLRFTMESRATKKLVEI